MLHETSRTALATALNGKPQLLLVSVGFVSPVPFFLLSLVLDRLLQA